MGRLDLPDVHRDEDDFYGFPVDSPCMAREAGDSIVLRATGEHKRAWVSSPSERQPDKKGRDARYPSRVIPGRPGLTHHPTPNV
jgi:hypothetical protein